MPVALGAEGSLGFAFESTVGTYVAPTRFIPIRSESLQFQDDQQYTRPIRGVADQVESVAGRQHIEGDIEHEVLIDDLVHFLHLGRFTVVKTGTAAPFNYVFTPAHGAEAFLKSASLTVVRAGQVFGYTGCRVIGFEITVDDGLLVATWNIMGIDEAAQGAPSPTWPTEGPMGHGSYDLEMPNGTDILDVDTFTFSVEESGAAEHRLSGVTTPQFIRAGEREVSLSMERDFTSRTEYDEFKNHTSKTARLFASLDASSDLEILLDDIKQNSYEVGLDGQGDLVRASIEYTAKYDKTNSRSYLLTVNADPDIT